MPHENEFAPIILSGWLQKLKRKQKLMGFNWSSRWCMIQNQAICWRHSKDSECAGSIDLELITSVHKVETLQKKRKNRNLRVDEDEIHNDESKMFVVKSKKRVLCLLAKSARDCDRWVRGLQFQLDKKQHNLSKKCGSRTQMEDKYEKMLTRLDQTYNECFAKV